MNTVCYILVYLGSALMVYNIWGFFRFATHIRTDKNRMTSSAVLYIPVVLLVFFLLGYLAVGIFLEPNPVVSLILFGGSLFVFVVYRLLVSIIRRIAESERKQAEMTAHEESARVKEEFLAMVSHEMRTPMNVIIGLDALALNERDISPSTKTYLEKIGLSAKHLLGLINNILDMNRIETGELTAKHARFSLKNAVRQVNAIAQTLCDEKKLTYSSDDSALCDICVGDEMIVKQVLLALLDNAVKYTDAPGTVELKISDGPSEDGKRTVQFSVKDTGVGIDPAFLPKIFDAFSKEDAGSTDRHGGSGVGLALTNRLVAMIGGSIGVESRKNVGSTFTVTLPLEPCEPETKEEAAKDRAEISLEGRRILIVEDLPENAEIAADLLELEGAESDRAENGEIGVEMFSSSPSGYYDAILMDLRMPVMDGLTATREIRKLDRPDAARVPIIALTANAFASDVRQTHDAGMNAHLAKPAEADLLYETLKNCIAQAADRKDGNKE